MRIYISADIEGVTGVVAAESGRPGGHAYDEYRDVMTRMVVTVCEAARELGVSEIVVSDSHGNGQNIRPFALPDYVHLVRSWPRPLGMMQGIESGEFDGAFLLGYHAGASSADGNLAHTLTGEFAEVSVNGAKMSEGTISAAIAAHFGVPILLFAGDDAAVREAETTLGDVTTVVLKTTYGRSSALNPPLAVMDERLRDGVRRAFPETRCKRPRKVDTPLDLELRLRNGFKAEVLGYLEGVRRTDAYTVTQRFPDIVALSKFLIFVASISVKNA